MGRLFSTDRKSMLAKVHVAKKQLGLADADYRAILHRATGRSSSADCSPSELDALLAEMKRHGFKAQRRSDKPHVRKIYALWRDLAAAGLVEKNSKDALAAWVARMTRSDEKPDGVKSVEWLTPPEGARLIEALKAWLARGTS